MDSTENLSCGQIVISKAGRDQGHLFVVMQIIDDDYVMLADGDIRKADRPKKKNVKHVAKHGAPAVEIIEKMKRGEKIENKDLRHVIAPLEIRECAQS